MTSATDEGRKPQMGCISRSIILFITISMFQFCGAVNAQERVFTLFFEKDKAAITVEAQQILKLAISEIMSGRGRSLVIRAYADGAESKADALAIARSSSVKTALIANGMAEKGIEIIENKKLDQRTSGAGYLNQRAEIAVKR